MKRWFSVSAAIVFSIGLAGSGASQVAPSSSQGSAGGSFLGSVTKGNTTIDFEAAGLSDINTQSLMTWQNFANAHPAIARTLAYHPSLMSNPEYLNTHPELRNFFQAHPEVRDAMAADPGNFDAIPPRPGE